MLAGDGRPSYDELAALVVEQARVIAELRARVAALEAENAELKRRLGMNSTNSSKPPSADSPFTKPAPKSLRRRSGRKPGGQPGHPGSTLALVADPNERQRHEPGPCTGCGASLADAPEVGMERRQVFDLPEGLDVDALTPMIAGRFLAARAAAGYTAHRSPKALSPLLGYLRGLGVAPLPTPVVAQGPVEMLLECYCCYLVGERGVGSATARGYAELVRLFVVSRATADAVDLAGLSSADVVGFVLAVSGERSPKTAQRTVSALRSLLRFCHVQGLTGLLDTAVPSVANRRAGLPRFLEPAQVAGLLASCDRTTVAGCRDFAMMTVMVRLGLRAGEVAALRLDDLDWRSGEITVVGKGPRRDRLPLPADVGEAIAGYLRHARPGAIDRQVFVRVEAPHRALTSGGVTQAVIAADVRIWCGVG